MRALSSRYLAAASMLAAMTMLAPSRSAAQADAALQQAEQAYLEVDFERTQARAGDALAAGGHSPAQLVRIYQLLGVSAAALGDTEQARDYFVRMLAIDSEARLDDTVPPRLRAPFLEARGVVSARTERLSADVGLARAQSSVRVALVDPFEIARRVRVHARIEGQLEFTTVEAAAAPEVMAVLEGSGNADRVEYYVEVLDQFGNQVLSMGTEFEPRVVGRTAVAGGAGGGGRSVFEEPAFWIVVAVVLVAGGAVGAAVAVDQQSRVPVQTGVSIGF